MGWIATLAVGGGLAACELKDGAVSTDGASDESGDDAADMGCTEVACNSSVTVTFEHGLDLTTGPHQFYITVPGDEITCSIPAQESGMDSCFSFPFANMEWDAETITYTMQQPFASNDDNPDGEPWTEMSFRITRGMEDIAEIDITLDLGEPNLPNGEGCPPTCYDATASSSIP